MRAETSLWVDAPPERVWALVSDVTRMGEWSPECVRCEWLDGSTGPAPGARFKGYNERNGRRWTMSAEVTAAEAGRRFSFRTMRLGVTSTRWEYVIEPSDGGSRVTEAFEVAPHLWVLAGLLNRFWLGVADRRADLVDGMRRTLERVKAAAEGARQ